MNAYSTEIDLKHAMLNTWAEEPVGDTRDLSNKDSADRSSDRAKPYDQEDRDRSLRLAVCAAARLYLEQMIEHQTMLPARGHICQPNTTSPDTWDCRTDR
ncbi:hypothetical protein AB0I45_01035 [Brevibacterium sp. NPDC049920]|uniref:hypothetical protein n=1 Tax=Brevibacterium sp. NPDC049920 TaxID=3155279 RepID=UPI0033EFE74A